MPDVDAASAAVTDPRIISLIASATEIVHALGLGPQQVARSHECDYPHSVLALPQITAPKFKLDGSSREIDIRVKAIVEQGLAVYEVDADRLKSLAPDVIVTQDHCEVCAVSLADVERALCTWTDSAARVVSCRPYCMADVYADIRRIASATRVDDRGEALVESMAERLDIIWAKVAGRPRPSLVFIEWIDPPMSGGHWMPELVDAAGGVNLLGLQGATSPWIAWDDVAAADPDVILVGPCGYDMAVTTREMGVLAANPVWQGLRAVREGRVFVGDGNAYFNRPGPRLVESAEILAELLHPGVADFGHLGTGYVRYRPADLQRGST